METHKKIREHISALADGALPSDDLELAFAALKSADGQQAWALYHRIGDVLRNQAGPELSDDFAARLAARLAAEPDPGKRSARAAGTGAAKKRGAAKAGAKPASKSGTKPPPKPATLPDEASLDAKAVDKPKPAIASVS